MASPYHPTDLESPIMPLTPYSDRPQTVFDTLRMIAHDSPDERISVEAFSKGLGRRGYGILMVTLNLPNLIPLPLPLLSFIFGLPLALVALQLLLGRENPWIPPFLLRRGIRKQEILYVCDQAEARYGRFHRWIHPRLPALTRRWGVRVIGFAICLLASMMVLPIPFGNLVLAIPIAILSLGLIERDGLFVILGLVLGVAGLFFNLLLGSSILYGMLVATQHLFG
ncbi:MAG: exopolysaccharide biosynthesis protein [Alphaproteobacteria bacterium]|nr:MAG: exopolysaccharide biosynthesis protein [Alphaproteobacteria bacterium]